MSVQFERGDLIFFRFRQRDDDLQSGGIVIALDDGLLTVALPHGVELWNLRSAQFVSAWRVEHTPRAMDEDEALEFAAHRLSELRRRPPVLVDPADDHPFVHEQHAAGEHAHAHPASAVHAMR
jgi:hypothetical protein